MPMLFGTHYCSKCGYEMFWEYHILLKKHSRETFQYTNNSHAVKLLNGKMSDVLEFRIICDKCNQIDFFKYDTHNLRNKTK